MARDIRLPPFHTFPIMLAKFVFTHENEVFDNVVYGWPLNFIAAMRMNFGNSWSERKNQKHPAPLDTRVCHIAKSLWKQKASILFNQQ